MSTHLSGHRGGQTFDAARDTVRLNRQAQDVWDVMCDGNWWTLHRLSSVTNHPEASISARMRDFRKPRFGAHTVERHNIGAGTWIYRLIPNRSLHGADDC